MGLEFFRDEDLKYISKRSTIDDNEKAVKVLQDLDIEIYASFIVRPEFDKNDFATFRQYCRKLRLSFATFAVLTPLPGTDLYEELKDQLITCNYDYFGFIHTLFPTRMPLKDFYEEYYQLYRKPIPFTKGVSLLRKFPLKEIPQILVRSYRVHNRLRKAYLDYSHEEGITAGN